MLLGGQIRWALLEDPHPESLIKATRALPQEFSGLLGVSRTPPFSIKLLFPDLSPNLGSNATSALTPNPELTPTWSPAPNNPRPRQ